MKTKLNMKYTIICILLLFNAISVFPQNYNLPEMQGLETPDGYIILEISGYDIYIDKIKGNLEDSLTVNDIAFNMGIENILDEYPENSFKVKSKVIEAETTIIPSPYLRTAQTCYLLQEGNNEITSLLFITINERNQKLEKAIVDEYLRNKLTPYIDKGKSKKSFYFLGRNIFPKEDWEMTNPHAVSRDGVQIRWSEFKTLEDAEIDIQNRLMLDKNDMKVVSEGNINVVFEGVATKAIRAVYNDGNSDYPLIAYYIAQKIRERYVSCILSNYGHNKDDYYLNSLLEEIMTIPQRPANAFRLPEPVTQPEEEYVHKTESYFEPWNFMDFQVGARIPVGNLSNRYSSATILAFYFKIFSVKSTMFDIGFQVGMPSGTKEFNYYYTKNSYDYNSTKADVLLNFSLRARREKRLQSNLRLQYYVGMGYESLSTDLHKGSTVNEYGEESDYNYAVRTMDFFGGINLKHKYVGLFFEYHYTPYSMFNKVASGFGNSSFHAGILLTL